MKALHTLSIFLTIIFGVFIGLSFGFVGASFLFGTKPYVVLSGSMEPTIPTGAVVFSKAASEYKPGDIITFSQNGNKKELVTHRLNEVTGKDGAVTFKTKGDANKSVDSWTVDPKNVVGKVSFKIPFLGYIVNFAQKPQGFILLVIIPATIIVYEEIKNLKNEITSGASDFKNKRLQKKREKELAKLAQIQKEKLVSLLDETPQKAPRLAPVYYLIVLLVLVGAAFAVGFKTSSAYFSDHEGNTGNVLGAAASFSNNP